MLPTIVKIGAHQFEVINQLNMADDHQKYGQSYSGKNRIHIASDIPGSRQLETLMHEILHACWYNQGLNEHKELKEYEEFLVNALAPIVYQVLVENQEIKWA